MNSVDDVAPRSNRLRTALLVGLIWTAYGALLYSQMRMNRGPNMPAPWKPYGPFVYWMGSAWLWAALTPAIAWLVRRLRPSWPRLRTIAALIVAFALIHVIVTLVDVATFYFIAKRIPANPLEGYQRGFVQTLLMFVLVASAVLALDHMRIARAREQAAARLETDLARARLDTLRRQIQPHFLFNTLNTIAELIESDPPRAGKMVAQLGDLLRRSLHDGEERLVRLGAELDFVRAYTDIERVRFESWLNIVEDVDPNLREALVPPMILQPLVENAIKHGIAPSRRSGTITIRAARSDERLRLEVVDDGVGVDHSNGREGIGLKTTRERIGHMFGEQGDFVIQSTAAGTRAVIEMPIILQHAANGAHA